MASLEGWGSAIELHPRRRPRVAARPLVTASNADIRTRMRSQTEAVDITVRHASEADGPRLQEIELAAGAQFRTVGMDDIADDEPFTLDELAAYRHDGRSFVAEIDGVVVGYIVIDIVGDAAHIEQVSVVPEAQGRGVGRALVGRAAAVAAERGLAALTLTTFRDVAWNAPLYAHLGFRLLADHELSAELRALRDRETAHGLDPSLRVCMRQELRERTTP